MEEMQYESRDLYLLNPKTNEIVGLHEIGFTAEGEKGPEWFCEERWGNPYDRFLNFLGNSFRVFEDTKKTAMEFVNDGWVDLDTDKVRKFIELTDELLMHKFFYYEKNAPIITDYEYDMKERDWQKLGTEIGLAMEDYPFWVDFDRNHPRAYYALRMAEKRLDQRNKS